MGRSVGDKLLNREIIYKEKCIWYSICFFSVSVFQCFRHLSVHWAMLILTTIVALQNSTGLLEFNKNSFTEFINRLAIILFFYIAIIHKKNYCYESSTQHVEYNYKWSIKISTFIAKHYSMGLYIRKELVTTIKDWNKRHLLINR